VLNARAEEGQRGRYRAFLVQEIADYVSAGPGYAGALANTRARLAAFDLLRGTTPAPTNHRSSLA
jgi:hypothetical protein